MESMEYGPVPMRKRKPSKKHPNGADQFRADHTTEYESRGKETNRAMQVDAHNAASPKMKDELDKRRSTGKITAPIKVMTRSRGINSILYDPHCRLCQKMRRADTKKRTPKRRSSNFKNVKKCRITKPRQRRMKSNFKLERVKVNKGCQYYSPYSNKGTSPDLALIGAETATKNMINEGSGLIYFSSRNVEPRQRTTNCDVLTNSSVSGVASKSEELSGQSGNPGTSANSLSSYNSNLSLDHEPMVSP